MGETRGHENAVACAQEAAGAEDQHIQACRPARGDQVGSVRRRDDASLLEFERPDGRPVTFALMQTAVGGALQVDREVDDAGKAPEV